MITKKHKTEIFYFFISNNLQKRNFVVGRQKYKILFIFLKFLFNNKKKKFLLCYFFFFLNENDY